MISSIVNGVLSHKRLSPVVHSFKYKHTMLLINLDDIEPIQKLPNFFRYNRFGVLSIRDSHYIDNSSNSINSKILKIFGNEIRNSEVSKCMLLTTPAVFGYSFNPVSFYFLTKLLDVPQKYAILSENHTFIFYIPVNKICPKKLCSLILNNYTYLHL